MKKLIYLFCFIPAVVFAGDWKQLSEQAELLFDEGQAKQAIPLGHKAIEAYDKNAEFTFDEYDTLVKCLVTYYRDDYRFRKMVSVYRSAIKQMRKHMQSHEHKAFVEYYLEIADIEMEDGSFKRSESAYLAAIKEAKLFYGEHDYEVAMLYQEMSDKYKSLYNFNWSKKTLIKARDIIYKKYAPDHIYTIKIDYLLAKLRLESKYYKKAEKEYSSILDRLASNNEKEARALHFIASGHLLHLYNEVGKTKELEVLWQKMLSYPRKKNDNVIPVLRTAPGYRKKNISRQDSGSIQLSYSVGVDGRVRYIQVLFDTTPKAYKEAVIEALKSWRYLPRIADSFPVEADGFKQRFNLNIGRHNR